MASRLSVDELETKVISGVDKLITIANIYYVVPKDMAIKEMLTELLERVREEGYDEGKEAGYQAGRDDGDAYGDYE